MPAWAAFTPRGIPAWLAGLSGFPQHKVQWVFFGFIDFDARPDFLITDFAA